LLWADDDRIVVSWVLRCRASPSTALLVKAESTTDSFWPCEANAP
jgi:hypothetical protein